MLCFIQDGDSHWYKMPVSKRNEFHDYEEAMENDLDWTGTDFSQYRCMHPCNYMMAEILVLKESNPFEPEELMIADKPISKPKIRKQTTRGQNKLAQ